MNGSIPLMENDIDITEKEEDRGKDQATLSKNSGQPCSSEEIAELINSSTSFNIRGVPYIQDSLELCNPTLRTAMLNDVKILKSWIESLFYNRFSAKPTKSDLSFAYDPTKQALIVKDTSGNQSFPSDFWDAINEELLNPSDPLIKNIETIVKNIENIDKQEFENANYPNGSKPTPVSQVTVPVKFKDPDTIVYDFKEKKYYQGNTVATNCSQLKSGPVAFNGDIPSQVPQDPVKFVETSHYRVIDDRLLRQTSFTDNNIKEWGCSYISYLNSAILAGMPTPTKTPNGGEVQQIFDMCKHFGYITGSATTQHAAYIGPMAALFLELTGKNGNHFTTLQNCKVEKIEYWNDVIYYPNWTADKSTHYTTPLPGGMEWDPYDCRDAGFTSLGMPDPTFLSQRQVVSGKRMQNGSPIPNFLPLPAGTVNDVIDYMHLKDVSAKDKENYILMYEKGISHDQLPQA